MLSEERGWVFHACSMSVSREHAPAPVLEAPESFHAMALGCRDSCRGRRPVEQMEELCHHPCLVEPVPLVPSPNSCVQGPSGDSPSLLISMR